MLEDDHDTTAPNANLINLADGADILVHEVMDIEAAARAIQNLPPAQQALLLRHFLESHSKVGDVPAVAQAASVGTLVMCHYSPAQVPPSSYLTQAQTAAATIGYTGTIIAPADLDTIPI